MQQSERAQSQRCDSATPWRTKAAALSGCGALLIVFASTAWLASLRKCATFDEPQCLVSAWIQTHDHDFRYDPEDASLWRFLAVAGIGEDRLKIDHRHPAWYTTLHDMNVPDTFASDVLYRTPGNDADPLIRAARARMLLWGLWLGAAIAWWAWRCGGPLAGVVAAAAFCFDPNFLAHSPLIKNDVPIVPIFVCLMATVWLLGERATWMRCLMAGLLLGAALATKYSGLLAIPVLGLALFARAMAAADWPMLRWIARTRLQRLGGAAAIGIAALAISYAVIWASYGFRFRIGPAQDTVSDLADVLKMCATGQAIRDHNPPWDVSPDQLAQWVSQSRPDGVIQSVLWANDRQLLPQSWLRGFLFIYGTTMHRASFLCGHLRQTGWWYYFPLAFVFKTPLATLIGLALATLFWMSKQRLRWALAGSHRWWPLCAAAILPVLYMASSIQSRLDLGLRHNLPVYAFLYIFLGVTAAEIFRRRFILGMCIVPALLVGLACETFLAYPDFIPFFNVAVGGSRGGAKLLGDSNLDWGQDLPALADWQRRHPDTQLLLCYFGSADPRYYGIHYVKLKGSSAPADQRQPSGRPPVCAFSVTVIQGIYESPELRAEYAEYLRNRPLLGVLGGSIYLFDGR